MTKPDNFNLLNKIKEIENLILFYENKLKEWFLYLNEMNVNDEFNKLKILGQMLKILNRDHAYMKELEALVNGYLTSIALAANDLDFQKLDSYARRLTSVYNVIYQFTLVLLQKKPPFGGF